MSRRSERANYDEKMRLDLLEADADRTDASQENLARTVHDEVGELRNQLVGLQRVLIGILVSLATSAVLLAVNIGVLGGK